MYFDMQEITHFSVTYYMRLNVYNFIMLCYKYLWKFQIMLILHFNSNYIKIFYELYSLMCK